MNIDALPLDTPALKPPPGISPNFHNPAGIQGRIYATLIFCLTISTILVWSRLYTRYVINKSHGWDDYTSFIAWAGFVGYIAIGLVETTYGSGIHQWNVRLRDFMTWAELANVLEVYYNPLIFVSKLSILLQNQKVFVPTHCGKTYWSIQFLIWSNLLFYSALMLVQIMACLPRERIWNPTVPGHCVNLPVVLIAGAAINIISDFAILFLPIGKIWQLQMSPKRKLGVSAVFATGLFACVSSILRLVNNVKFAHTDDVTFQLTPVALWTMAEVTSRIVCGCLPILPQLFQHYVHKLRKNLIATLPTLVNAHYMELDEHSQSKGGLGTVEEGRKQDARSEAMITAHRNLYEERPAIKDEIYTERTVTVE